MRPDNGIETRPTLSIDFTPQDAPPRNEVVFFDTVAIEDPATLQQQLESWPPAVGAILTERQARAGKAIGGILEASGHGRTVEYDDPTWGALMNDDEYRTRSERLQARADKWRDVGKGVDHLREHTAVRGLHLYVGLLNEYLKQQAASETAA